MGELMGAGIVIAGTHSGCGKTTITLGVLAALKKTGLTVQSFKAGPDFIDAGLHRLITGSPSRNLDLWMCGGDYVKSCFDRHSHDADISVIEGVMGLYDGDFSTARLADELNLPVILIVDAYGMAESAGAIVKGFMEYSAEERKIRGTLTVTREPEHGKWEPEIRTSGLIGGVIFNRVASERHYERLKNSVRDVKVLGYLPRDLNFKIPHRHLGLTVAEENPIAEENIERLADAVLGHIDMKAIEQQSSRAAEQQFLKENNLFHNRSSALLRCCSAALKIAVAYDKAFCFYYEDNLDLLRNARAEIIKFSPLHDKAIPKADALYIGGGYPELYANELSKNRLMLEAIYNWANSGKPMYAECGGLMYLSKGIHNFEGKFFQMAGILPFETQMKKERFHLGYREIKLREDCILGKKGNKLRGHEFHYSSIVQQSDRATVKEYHNLAYALRNNKGERLADEGYIYKNTLASYIHIHFGSNPAIAENFINFIKERQWNT
jgi:cobyrinic acid a,c-diamide synthase